MDRRQARIVALQRLVLLIDGFADNQDADFWGELSEADQVRVAHEMRRVADQLNAACARLENTKGPRP